jgi:transcriptional regulator with XRE-family HTH domain
MARPKIELDISRVEEYAAQGLTQAEICLCLGISENTLYRRKADMEVLADAIKRGKAKAASEVANVLYLKATKDKDLGAIIWYEKTRRGLSDRTSTEITGKDGAPIQLAIDRRAALAPIAPGPVRDSDTPSDSESDYDGA